MTKIVPFANESDSLSIGDLTVENRTDRVSIYGSAAITKDQAGLKLALALKALVDAAVAALQAEDLPEAVVIDNAETVPNPFDKAS